MSSAQITAADTTPVSQLLQQALANPPSAASLTGGNAIPETDPSYLAFAAGQGWREAEAQAYTALKQNAIYQAYQDQLPKLILNAQQTALGTAHTYGDAGAWRTGGRVQEQARNTADFENSITSLNDTQQSQQNDLEAQLAAHIANLQMDTSQARLEAAQNASLQTAAQGSQAYTAPSSSQTSATQANAANPANPGS